ncbi:MAG: SDR family oxidoreductase [Actinobacteria bacterium]|nr:SDR family oxidoreductase [Actinomycetota bacterium]
MRLRDKVAIITGAGSGIGEATAMRFVGEGAKLVLADVNVAGLERVAEAVRERGGTVIFLRVDVSNAADVEAMVKTAVDQLGRIDILINNAGVIRDKLSWKMTEEQWDAVIDVNLKGTFLCCRAVTPTMQAQNYGKIVNTSSISSLGNPGQANYSAAKAGISALTRTLALELARNNINVNCVAPGSIDTPMIRSMPPEVLNSWIENSIPLRRMGQPSAVANVHLFLASSEADYITGQTIFVDGGISVGL